MLQHSIDGLGRGDGHDEDSGRGNLAPLQWRKGLRHTTCSGNRGAALIRIMREMPRAGSKIARNIISRCEACELRGSLSWPDWVVENQDETRHHYDKQRE